MNGTLWLCGFAIVWFCCVGLYLVIIVIDFVWFYKCACYVYVGLGRIMDILTFVVICSLFGAVSLCVNCGFIF